MDSNEKALAEECYDALSGSCITRFPKNYKIICISSPRYEEDFMLKQTAATFASGEVLWEK